MGFGIAVAGMITSLKNNANLLKKKAFRERKDGDFQNNNLKLKFKEVPKDELEQIKAQIRVKAKRQRRISNIVSVSVFILVISVLAYSGIRLKAYFESAQRAKEKEIKQQLLLERMQAE